MAKIRWTVPSLLAVLAVSMVMSASASAHEFIVNGTPIAVGEEVAIEGNQDPILPVVFQEPSNVVKRIFLEFVCQSSLLLPTNNKLLEGGKANLEFEFNDCSVSTSEFGGLPMFRMECMVVNNNIVTNPLTGELTAAEEITIKPKRMTEPIASFKVKQLFEGCEELAGEYKIEGSFKCRVLLGGRRLFNFPIECVGLQGGTLTLDGAILGFYSKTLISGTIGQHFGSN
jgi:hypothetical protein